MNMRETSVGGDLDMGGLAISKNRAREVQSINDSRSTSFNPFTRSIHFRSNGL